MPFSTEFIDQFYERRAQLDDLKKNVKIGIFGSFYGSRKTDLLSLKQFLHSAGYNPGISEDLDMLKEKDLTKRDLLGNRKLSEHLILTSVIHIFVLVRSRPDEPDNLIQSVSMEIERLHTLNDCGLKSAKYVAVYTEKGLIGTMGSVCEGLLLSKKGDWVVEEFTGIQDIFKPARQFCLNRLGHNLKMIWLLINSCRKYPQFEFISLRSWGYDPACEQYF